MVAASLLAQPVWLATPALAQGKITADRLPTLGDPTVDELSPMAEQKLGQAIWKDLQRQKAVYEDPEIQAYLTALGQRLLQAAQQAGYADPEQTVRLFAVKDPTLNAFALPGGYIGVHTGLIAATANEGELASVLAHEIGHVTQRHIARMLSRSKQTSLLMMGAMVLAMLAASNSPNGAQGMMALGSTLAIGDQMGFSRDAEREADRIGLVILQGAGFAPQTMIGMFQKLQQASKFYESVTSPAYLRSHPMTVERYSDVQARLRDLGGAASATAGAASHAEFEFALVRARARAMSDTSVDGLRTQARRLQADLNLAQSDLDKAALNYGLAVIALEQRQFMQAQTWLDKARQLAPAPHPAFDRLQILRQAGLGEQRERLRLAQQAVARYPDSVPLQREVTDALMANGRDKEATDLLLVLVRQHKDDAALWGDLAKAWQAQGKSAQHHAAMAERYVLLGGTQAAIEQLTLARQDKQANFVDASMIDARLTELRAQRRIEVDEERRR